MRTWLGWRNTTEGSRSSPRKSACCPKIYKKRLYLHMRTTKYKVGDTVYWPRNVGKNVQSVWFGLGIVTQIKSDTVYMYVSRTRRVVKIMTSRSHGAVRYL